MKIEDITKFVLVLGLTGIVIGLMLTIIGTLSVVNRDDISVVNQTISNSTWIGVNLDACYSLGYYTPCGITAVVAWNYTGEEGILVPSTNYVACTYGVDVCGINISEEISGSTYNYTGWANVNVSFGAKAESEVSEVMLNTSTALKTLPVDWMEIIVIIGALSIVLGLVVGAFAMFGSRAR